MQARSILTAAEMRAAEMQAVAARVSEATLMERAGVAAATAIRAYAGAMPALVLCGPGNNGGDGYVIARILQQQGVPVRVAASGAPRKAPATDVRAAWTGAVEALDEAEPAPLLIDALFGTGLTRPLDEAVASPLSRLGAGARLRVAIDLPSGVDADTGALLSDIPAYELTVTFGALKPAHLLQPAARSMGRIIVADIGVACRSDLTEVTRPRLALPGPDDHKYKRGYVSVQAGKMAGAAALVATAAARVGAGYVAVSGERIDGVPSAIVQEADAHDPRIGARVLGPGLGRDAAASALLADALAAGTPLILDADALHLLDHGPLPNLSILTPHAGEFHRLFGDLPGSKVDQARAAAKAAAAVIVFKGADTVIAAPDGKAAIIAPPPALATAGTGDVLAGVIAAMRARGLEAFEAACAGTWLHARAGALAGPGLIADDLLDHLPVAAAECL